MTKTSNDSVFQTLLDGAVSGLTFGIYGHLIVMETMRQYYNMREKRHEIFSQELLRKINNKKF
jgi:hypothetical protein